MGTHSFVIAGKDYEVEVGAWDGNRVTVKVNGKTHVVEVKSAVPGQGAAAGRTANGSIPPPAPLPSIPVGTATTPSTAPGSVIPGQVCAPMAGQVLAISVSEGQIVEIGDELLILDAMKMENKITSTVSGVVEKISVTVHQTVNRGDVLITIRA